MNCKRTLEGRFIATPAEERFEKFVVRTPTCWIWTGAILSTGYGLFRMSRRKQMSAHRAAYTLFRGPVPDGLHVPHTCDTTACVRPDHLYAGTPRENSEDMVRRGRGRTKSIFGEDEIRTIRALSAVGVAHIEMAKSFGCCGGTINNIVARRSWKHIA